jgi:hypothetical protein
LYLANAVGGGPVNLVSLAVRGTAMEPTLYSVITCPECGATAEERMPTDACIFFYECKACRTLLRPTQGHCCVFCAYGSVKCPPVQAQGACCAE